MAQKSITLFIPHVVVYRVGFLDFNHIMVIFDNSTMVLLKSKDSTRYATSWRKTRVINFCDMVLLSNIYGNTFRIKERQKELLLNCSHLHIYLIIETLNKFL